MHSLLSFALSLVRSLTPLFVVTFAVPAFGQAPATTPKQIAIRSITVEPAALPGTNRNWIKVVTTFQSAPAWADGIAFNYSVLIGVGSQFRVLPGIVRYANVKGGINRAVMYISPNTVERFGSPMAARIKVFYKDELVDESTYKGKIEPPANWETQVNKYQGLLLTVIHTPWLITDYSNSPDIFVAQ